MSIKLEAGSENLGFHKSLFETSLKPGWNDESRLEPITVWDWYNVLEIMLRDRVSFQSQKEVLIVR